MVTNKPTLSFLKTNFSNVYNMYLYVDNVYVDKVYVYNLYVDNEYFDIVYFEILYINNVYMAIIIFKTGSQTTRDPGSQRASRRESLRGRQRGS